MNAAYFKLWAAVAAVLGLVCGSWEIFWISLLIFLAAAVADGGIRLTPRDGRDR